MEGRFVPIKVWMRVGSSFRVGWIPSPEHQCVMRIPANFASAPSVVWPAFKPSVKSASENVSNKSVVWCQCGFAPLPVS